MKGEDVDFSVAKVLFQSLSGFRGYPKPGPGEDHFVEAFQSSVVSVAHARAVIASFDEGMPTIREIRDSAFNLRSQFETTVDQRKEWEAKYGKPDPAWSANLMGAVVQDRDPVARKIHHQEERRGMIWQAIRDSLYYAEGPGGGRPSDFWQDAADKHKRNHPQEVAAFRAQLAQSGWDTLMAIDWTKAIHTAPIRRPDVRSLSRPITQSDINAELRAQGREPGDGE